MMLNNEMREVVDRACKDIAIARKAMEITEHDVKEFDEELNEMCEKWHEKIKDMDEVQFMMFMIGDLVDVSAKLVEKEKDDGDK